MVNLNLNLTRLSSPFSFLTSNINYHFNQLKNCMMFVFRKDSLPVDPIFPVDLKELGYFINENDQIRMIDDPEKVFLYKINSNERYNEMQKEAMNNCIREIVLSRLQKLGLETLRLPLEASPKTQHVPILVSSSLKTHSRVTVVFGEPAQDLGIWAYRTVGQESINTGSAVDFSTGILGYQNASSQALKSAERDEKSALILSNPGQLIWHCKGERAVSLPTWHAIPRPSAVDPPMKMSYRNKIPGNENWQDHVTYVFEEVLSKLVSKDAKIDIIGLTEGGLGAIRYLAEHWPTWQSRISAICLGTPLHDMNHLHPPEFAKFISKRCRAYVTSLKPLDHAVPGRYMHGCNCYSSGEPLYTECIMPRAWPSMTSWLNRMHGSQSLEELEIVLREEFDDEQARRAEEGESGDGQGWGEQPAELGSEENSNQ